jgi:hypothetical protein
MCAHRKQVHRRQLIAKHANWGCRGRRQSGGDGDVVVWAPEQQMRNCLYMGDATRFLKQEAGTAIFLEATQELSMSKPLILSARLSTNSIPKNLPCPAFEDTDNMGTARRPQIGRIVRELCVPFDSR